MGGLGAHRKQYDGINLSDSLLALTRPELRSLIPHPFHPIMSLIPTSDHWCAGQFQNQVH